MQYNVDKCHILHLGKDNRGYEYQLGGRTLETSKWQKDVGVIINDDLKPSLQCGREASKANQVLGQIGRGVTLRDKDSMSKLFKTYVRPHLEYCQAAWSPWSIGDKQVLEKVQQRAVKMMTNLKSKTYEASFKELGLTTLEGRRKGRHDHHVPHHDRWTLPHGSPFTMAPTRDGVASTR